MTAADFGARALARRALEQAPRTFSSLASAGPGEQVQRVDSSGHVQPGRGAAHYVADAKADAALLAAHPRAVFRGSGNRHFRLAGTPDGFVTPEMLGCPEYAPGTDQRPYIQAAIDYAKAVGLNGVYLSQEVYELWAPPRTGSYDNNTDHSGSFLVIDGFACALIGKHGHRSKLHCKGRNGGSLATDYQVMQTSSYGGGDVIWRGHGIKLTGRTSSWLARPAEAALSHTIIRDIILFSDAVGVRNTAWPAFPPSRDPARENCWDTSNKGIYCQQDRHIGDIVLENVDVIGFLGECFYAPAFGSNDNCRVTARNVTFKHSNGQALNPNGMASMEIDGLYVENCSMGIEGWFGYSSGRLTNAYFRKCNMAQITGGSGYDTPLRADGSQPVLTVDNVVFDDCGDIYIGSYVHGALTLIDSRAALVTLGASGVIRNTCLDITAVVHKASISTAIRYAGWPGVSQAISNTQIRLRACRTKSAIDNGFIFNALWSQGGSLGPRNYLYARGEGFAQIGSAAGVTDNYVALVDEGLDFALASAPVFFDPSATPSPEMAMGALRGGGYAAGNGVYPVNLPATTMYPHNAEIAIEHRDSAKEGCFMEIREGSVKRALLGYRDKARFRCNRLHNRWELANAISPRSASASVQAASTAKGGQSGPYTIPAPGCRPYHTVSVTPSAATGGFAVTALRAESDVVRFWLHNLDGADPEPAATITYTARWWLPPS